MTRSSSWCSLISSRSLVIASWCLFVLSEPFLIAFHAIRSLRSKLIVSFCVDWECFFSSVPKWLMSQSNHRQRARRLHWFVSQHVATYHGVLSFKKYIITNILVIKLFQGGFVSNHAESRKNVVLSQYGWRSRKTIARSQYWELWRRTKTKGQDGKHSLILGNVATCWNLWLKLRFLLVQSKLVCYGDDTNCILS